MALAWLVHLGSATTIRREPILSAPIDDPRVATPRSATTWAATLLPVVGAGIVVLLGLLRAVGAWPARQGMGGTVAVTAAALTLAGIALLLLCVDRHGAVRGSRLVSRAAAVAAAAAGLVVLGQYGADWAIAAGRGTLVPGPSAWARRPPPTTALSLLLIGFALVGTGSRYEGPRRWAGRAAVAVLVVAATALVGHAYGASALYGLNRLGGMAVFTALSLTTIALGVLFADPTRGFAAIFLSESAGGRLLRRLTPAAIFLPPLLGYLTRVAQERELVDAAFGMSLLVVATVVVFVGLLVQHATALHAFDTERARLHIGERTARSEAERAWHAAERALRAADEANQAKSAFLATMSHEIRTPINAMIGYAQLMELGLAGPVTQQQHDYLARLAATSEHLRGLVDDVLDLAKIDAGGMTVAREPGQTGALVAAALDLVRPQASAKGVRLVDARPGEGGEPFVGDEHRVRQILANLLSNAVKFTDAGGTITVGCDRVDTTPQETELRGAGPWTRIRVADTGIGIPAREQTRIFDPFHQVDAGRTRRQGGTGLGLAISRRLARLMGGDLTVVSSPGVGSTFTLWLPAAGEGAAGAESARDRGARARQEPNGNRVHGLAEVGIHLREQIEDVIASHAARMRADGAFPNAARLRRAELEDHQLSFLSDVAQTLVVIEDTGGLESDLMRDGSTIQRVIAELHGTMRQRRGWTEEQLSREYTILRDEIVAAVRRRVPDGTGDVSVALEVLDRLLDRARTTGVAALRRAAESATTREAAS